MAFCSNPKSIEYVPIDFIKAQIIGLEPTHFFKNQLLLNNPKSIYNGEFLSKTIFKYKNLSITIFENNQRIEFSGSLHTYYNEGLHNWNDFSFNAFKEALRRLYADLGILPKNLYLIHLEWGFNLCPPFESNYILDNLIQHGSVNKTTGIDCKIEGKYIQFKHSNYILKVYNKGQQYRLSKEVLRIEIKRINWSKYRLNGIVTLEDYIKTNKAPFLNELILQWNRVVFYDINNNLNTHYLHYGLAMFWTKFRIERNPRKFKYHFDKLKLLNVQFGFNNQQKITELIKEKCNELQL